MLALARSLQSKAQSSPTSNGNDSSNDNTARGVSMADADGAGVNGNIGGDGAVGTPTRHMDTGTQMEDTHGEDEGTQREEEEGGGSQGQGSSSQKGAGVDGGIGGETEGEAEMENVRGPTMAEKQFLMMARMQVSWWCIYLKEA